MNPSRREALRIIGGGTAAACTAGGVAAAAADAATTDADAATGSTIGDAFASFFQKNYRAMSPDEVAATVARLERKYKRETGVDVKVGTSPPLDNVVFGYALNVSKCKGYRDCVSACAKENNTGRNSQMEYIRVLEMPKGTLNLEESEHYYDGVVPKEGNYYLPVQCMQCDNPPCVKACPVEATWKEKDGIVVIDYDWCIGCRYCATACPYWARHFNWEEPELPKEEINPVTDYLSNRPRTKGVMEKCTFCLQRTRNGKNPACQVACPTGARVFGNLLDPKSEIRWVLENKTVFRLKEELNTEPKFWYYTD